MVWFQRIQAAIKSKAVCFTVSIVVDFFRLSYGLVSSRRALLSLKSSRHWNARDAGLLVDLTMEEASADLGQGLHHLTPHPQLAANSA
jgi:hypothetical protein